MGLYETGLKGPAFCDITERLEHYGLLTILNSPGG